MRKKFEDLTKEDLWQLRCEIVLNSLFVSDYKNTFGFDAHSVLDFFAGYIEHLEEIANEFNETGSSPSVQNVIELYDTADNLFDYYWGCDDYSWVNYFPEWTAEEEKKYEDFWNGTE